MAHGQYFCEQNRAPQARFLCQKTAPQAELIKENAPQAISFD